jgi:hypothetical protein
MKGIFMNKKTAGLVFLGIGVVLAILLIIQWITPLTSGVLFALSLVLLGGLSKGFRKR